MTKKRIVAIILPTVVIVSLFVIVNEDFDIRGVIRFDATHSGGKASDIAVEKSTSKSGNDYETGGGTLVSDSGGGGFQQFTRDEILTFGQRHEIPAGGSSTGLFILKWNHQDKITVIDIDLGDMDSIVTTDETPIVLDDNNFGGKKISEQLIGYKLEIPDDFTGSLLIPVTFVVESHENTFVGKTAITVEILETGNVSIWEWIRSLVSVFRLSLS